MKKPIIEISDCVLCDICVDLCPDFFIKNQAGYIELSENFENIDKYLIDKYLDDIKDEDKKREIIKRLEDDINEVIKNCRGDCVSWE
ncbi:MAG: ferredoxin [Desulfamplus sp.]|nr:ferredoxin [Desulfamplus sp.]